jgi:cytochrome c-type biogenesis protein CcmH/NrfF
MTVSGIPLRRRAFLGATLGALVPVARVPQDTTVARLQQPDLAGRPRRRVTNYENDPFIIGVERRLRCTCGCGLDIYTCRTTDFTCTYSPQLHLEVVALVEQDRTAEEILAAFVAKYGETALMAPPKAGFNWAGYLLPGIAIALAGAVLGWVLMRRARARAPVPAKAGEGPGGLTSDEAARLRDELARLES